MCQVGEKANVTSLRYSGATLLLMAGWLDTEVLCNGSWARNYLMSYTAFDVRKGRNLLPPGMEPSGNVDLEMQRGNLC